MCITDAYNKTYLRKYPIVGTIFNPTIPPPGLCAREKLEREIRDTRIFSADLCVCIRASEQRENGENGDTERKKGRVSESGREGGR